MENGKYAVYHDDTLDREVYQQFLANLAETDDLTQVYNQDYIYIFENNDYQPYVQIQNRGFW